MKKLVIIGHGMVGQRLLERLAATDTGTNWQVTVIGEEPRAAYNRILLSTYLSDELDATDLPLAKADWYRNHGIRCITDNAAVAIDRGHCTVELADGETVGYDHLVLATGAEPVVPALPGAELKGVQVFRDWADCETLRDCHSHARQAVVIGGGFLGLEAAAGLNKRGIKVTVLHRSGHLLNRQLDRKAGRMLQEDLTRRGLAVHCDAQVEAIEGVDQVEAVRLDDGTRIAAQLVVFATGIQPRRALAEAAGVHCDRGIRVDQLLRTSDARISALGECCQLGERTYGLVEPGYRQADVLAARLRQIHCGSSATRVYTDTALATRLKISGVELFSCGQIETDSATESLVYQDRELGHYRRLLIRNQRLVGVILYGDSREGPWYFKQLQENVDISIIRKHLAFGEAYCEAA